MAEVIPVEAVEAAAKRMAGAAYGLWELVPEPKQRLFLRDARLALEAAAPHMLREVWQSAYTQGIVDERMSATSGTDYGPNRNNPYDE